jgi:hypothetical protein
VVALAASYNPVVEAFAGIDVAFAKRKRLPVCLCVWNDCRLIPLPLADRDAPLPPRGYGNVASLEPATVASFADETAHYLRLLEKHFRVSIRRIAIDAPSDHRLERLPRRLAERALDDEHIRYFATPSGTEFETIRAKVHDHLTAGRLESRLPHANQLWMLVGFALFKRLRIDWKCLEAYPYAIWWILGASCISKTQPGGLAARLEAVSRYAGWPEPPSVQLREALKAGVRAPLHDALDAYSSAWVAALDPQKRRGLGLPPNDVIWVPQLPTA